MVARSGGEVAGIARVEAEKRTGKPVITSKNAVDFTKLLGTVIEDTSKGKKIRTVWNIE